MDKNVARYENWFRQATPLFLLMLLLVVLFERWLPYRPWIVDTFGEDIVLKGAVLFLIGYVLLLWGESLRLHGLLTGLLEAFKAFDRDRAGEGAGPGGANAGRSAKAERAARDPRARLEAARLLIAAMGSGDDSVRETSHHNLVRLVGEDFGQDPANWQEWLAKQPKS